jgi:hypothetical protein
VGVVGWAERVRDWFTGPEPETWTLPGERVSPAGTWSCPATRERAIVPVKPFWGVTVRVVWPLDPCCTVRLVGFRERVKPGWGRCQLQEAKRKRAKRAGRPRNLGEPGRRFMAGPP